MFTSIFYVILGLVLILVGANALTDGASALARRFGLSDLLVGLTVVAIGTSTPELVISTISAMDGSAGMAIGNVVGSNVFNILAIIGITAIIHPVVVSRSILSREIPMVIISSVVLLILGNTALLDGGGASTSVVSRSAGLLLLVFIAIFFWYTIASAKREPNNGAADPTAVGTSMRPLMPLWRSIVWVVVGLAMLIYGGDRFVEGASEIASVLGVSDAVIGLTIAAVGTSLPELATSIAAAMKGRTEMAVGNVIGSNIFNIFAVLGVSATITPLQFDGIGNIDLVTLLGASLLFLLFGWLFGTRTFTRGEGWVMVALYISYIAVKVSMA